MVVVSYDLYTKARRSLRRIERPWSGCLRGSRTEMFPVVAAHIRVDIELSSTIWERAFECCVMGGKVSGRVEWKRPE